jgi:osmotically-inducible protein OsmY
MTDEDLRLDVVAELSWDPKVGSEAIGVSADAGAITLHGTVSSLRERQEAGKAAARVYGVTCVSNQLRLVTLDHGCDDTDLRGDVLDALMLDGLIPMTVDARVRDGFVTLTGTAVWHYQRDEAEFLTASLPGVSGVADEIMLTSAPDGHDITRGIIRAFRRSAVLHGYQLCVQTASYGSVIVAGTVHSWSEHDEAMATAWSAPGVTDIDDRIVVEYPDC